MANPIFGRLGQLLEQPTGERVLCTNSKMFRLTHSRMGLDQVTRRTGSANPVFSAEGAWGILVQCFCSLHP